MLLVDGVDIGNEKCLELFWTDVAVWIILDH